LLKLLETETWYYPLFSNNGKFLLESNYWEIVNKKSVEHSPCSYRAGLGPKNKSLF